MAGLQADSYLGRQTRFLWQRWFNRLQQYQSLAPPPAHSQKCKSSIGPRYEPLQLSALHDEMHNETHDETHNEMHKEATESRVTDT